MNILFIGDIFGSSGRRAVKEELPIIIKDKNIDLVIANAENTTHGRSCSIAHYNELMSYGVNYFTFGNHTWHLKEISEVLANANTIRPLNLNPYSWESKVGKGTIEFKFKNKNIRITNLLGLSVDMKGLQTNPFISLQKVVDNDTSDIHIVDFHCETTSEKNALLLTFASKVSAILGTHTHIQTNDNIIYHDTAYITDTGSCCGSEGIIGANAAPILDVYNERSSRFKMEPSATKYKFNAVVLSFDDVTNLPLSIEKINIIENKK